MHITTAQAADSGAGGPRALFMSQQLLFLTLCCIAQGRGQPNHLVRSAHLLQKKFLAKPSGPVLDTNPFQAPRDSMCADALNHHLV
jgi:hypothetical protein